MTPQQHRFHARDGLPLAAFEWPGPAATHGRATLLCLPGLCRTGLDFERLAARHAGQRRILALDYAGHGDSGRAEHPARYTPEQALRDVLDAMAALHAHRVVVVGTSFGGLLAIILAVIRPAALAGIVLNDIGPRIDPAGLAEVENFVATDRAFADLPAVVAWLREVMPPMSFTTEAEWLRFAELTVRPEADGALRPRWDRRLIEAMRNGAAPDLGTPFRAVAPIPALLVWGELSRILSATTVAAMRAAKPDLRVVSVPGVGHVPSLNEAQVAPILDRFIAALP